MSNIYPCVLRKLTVLFVWIIFIGYVFAGNITVSINKDQKQSILSKENVQQSITAFSFEDYVSNPQPGRSDPFQGCGRTYDSPFEGLLKPISQNTKLTPLPKAMGLLIESDSGTVGFHDITNNAACSDVGANNLIFRFVNPENPQNAATVSHVAFTMTGKAVKNGKLKFSLYDVSGNIIHTDFISPGSQLNGLRTDIECIAYDGKEEKSLIHKVIIENTGSEYFVIGTGQYLNQNDFAFSGFKKTDEPLIYSASEEPKIVHSMQWKKQFQSVLFTDMSQIRPEAALSPIRKKGKWKVIEYETFDFEGKALTISSDSEAPPITLKINQKGWHAIYVGVGTVANLIHSTPNKLKVKLSSESTYARISNRLKLASPRRDVIEEIYIKAADLTGEDIVIDSVHNQPALLCYVKLVPLTEDEVRQIKEDRKKKDVKPMVATIDGHGWIWPFNAQTKNDLKNMFYFFKDSDFKIWWYQVLGADLVHYKSNVGNVPGHKIDAFPRPADKSFTESVLNLISKEINPLEVALDTAHEQNSQMLVMVRAQGWKGSHPLEDNFSSDFYEQHPKWRCVDYDGTPIMHMSYAVPQVQDHLIDVLAEALEFGCDGAGILFHRGMPTLLWEEPFRIRFKKKFGVDPLKIPENDPRIYELRSDIMTEFIQKIRTLLDETQQKTGRKEHMPLAVSTFSTKKDNEKFGLDVERWINLGLIDQIGVAWFAYHTSLKNPVDMEYYESITKNTPVKVFPFVVGWKLISPADLTNKVANYYEQGAEGIAVWDPFPNYGWKDAEGNSWPILSRIGHEKEVISGDILCYKTNRIKLKRLGQNYYSRWYPNVGF